MLAKIKDKNSIVGIGECIMGQFTIYADDCLDVTVISNKFIDEYMKDANDAQIKVYLYLLRMMSASLATSVSEIADKFNHTEKDVVRALKYWEKMQLLSLDYSDAKTLCGIRLKALCKQGQATVGQSTNTEYAILPEVQKEVILSHAPASEAVVFSASKSSEQPEYNYTKPNYTADDLRNFKSKEETSQLLFVAERYIGRPLSVADMKSILYFSDVLHFSDDLIDYLIQYCVDRGKKDFKYIEAVAINWAEAGITTPKQAEKYATKYDKSVYTIMKELGKNGTPTNKELEYINRWIKEYGFSSEIIAEACERTVMATDNHRFEYAEGILSNWKKENVHRKSDIQRIDELYQKRKQQKISVAVSTGSNKFNQFPQRDYDFEELEAKLLSK